MNNGKIYKLVCNVTGDTYYGSTIQSLKRRLQKHKVDYKRYLNGKLNYYTSFKIIENANYDIYLVEDYGCLNRKQLQRIEGIYIKYNDCINKRVEGRTRKESMNAYYEKNRDKKKEYLKKYRENNRDKLKEYKNQKFYCPCGGRYTHANKARHYKSKKHINNCN